MNQELIEQLMEECTEYWTDKGDIYFDKEKFAALVAAAEREACAKLVEVPDDWETWQVNCGEEGRTMCNEISAEIRARGETK